MQKLSRDIVELTLTPRGCREELVQHLEEQGFHDFIEGSCDDLDADAGEETAWVEAFEAGRMELALVLYSYDEEAIATLMNQLQQRFGERLQLTQRRIADSIWQTAWEPGFELLETQLFVICSPQVKAGSSGKQRIVLESGAVFGSGQHATTQAMVRLMEQISSMSRIEPEAHFLDVGTGTGVLALVAHYLGFRHILATDIEPQALAMAQHNQYLNQVSFPLLEGSLPPPDRRYHMIVCNILPPTLTHLLPALKNLLEPGGCLLLAGFHEANGESIILAGKNLGLLELRRVVERGWIALSLQKKAL